MKKMNFLGAALLASCVLTTPATAGMRRAVAEIGTGHAVAENWGSQVPASGAAYMVYDTDNREIIELVVTIDGIAPDTLAPVGPGGALGAIHIHNMPQGGPDFFVQQLPGTITETASGFEFRLERWTMTDPMVGPALKPDQSPGDVAAFVLSEVAAGNAYFGLHTTHALCPGNTREGMVGICKAPATALSGAAIPLPLQSPQLLAYMNDR